MRVRVRQSSGHDHVALSQSFETHEDIFVRRQPPVVRSAIHSGRFLLALDDEETLVASVGLFPLLTIPNTVEAGMLRVVPGHGLTRDFVDLTMTWAFFRVPHATLLVAQSSHKGLPALLRRRGWTSDGLPAGLSAAKGALLEHPPDAEAYPWLGLRREHLPARAVRTTRLAFNEESPIDAGFLDQLGLREWLHGSSTVA